MPGPMTGDALDKGSPDVYFLSRSHRENATTVIILCDIDHFKGVNDSFGHLVGDEVLRETAKRLLASVRTYDFVGRYGGEEFLVVLNNCDPTFALARAEEIRNTIAQRPVQTSTGPVPLTITWVCCSVTNGARGLSKSCFMKPTGLSTKPNGRAAMASSLRIQMRPAV
jgi:diguanylate cyclase (GGDEF)-like protein